MKSYIKIIADNISNFTYKVNNTIKNIEDKFINFFYEDDQIISNDLKILIFECENDKLYIEVTNNVQEITDFYLGKIKKKNLWCEWLLLNEPIKILTILDTIDGFDEDKYQIYFMYLFGIDNVRGGSFIDPVLSDKDICVITKIINKCKSKYLNKKIINENYMVDNQYDNIKVITFDHAEFGDIIIKKKNIYNNLSQIEENVFDEPINMNNNNQINLISKESIYQIDTNDIKKFNSTLMSIDEPININEINQVSTKLVYQNDTSNMEQLNSTVMSVDEKNIQINNTDNTNDNYNIKINYTNNNDQINNIKNDSFFGSIIQENYYV